MNELQSNEFLKSLGVQRLKHIYDFIREEKLPEAEDEEFFLWEWLKIRRPLKPRRMERKVHEKHE